MDRERVGTEAMVVLKAEAAAGHLNTQAGMRES